MMNCHPVGTRLVVNGITLTRINTLSIRKPDLLTLKLSKLDALQKENPALGFDAFANIINDPKWRNNKADGEPIRLTKIPTDQFGISYELVNGRHRVYLAMQKGFSAVWAWVENP